MELKVWVEGLQRVICGVSDVTTCQDVVIALAQATGKTGRFTLVEKWRDSERLLSPSDNPLKILRKWGEYASDVQFVLCQSDKAGQRKSGKLSNHLIPPAANRSGHSASNGNIKKALSFSGAHVYLGSIDSGHDQSKGNYENSLETLSEGTSSDSREVNTSHTETPGERNKHHAQQNRPRHNASHPTTSLGHRAHLNGPTNDGYHSLERKPKAHILEGRNNALYGSLERRPKPSPRQHFDNRFQKKNVLFEGVVPSSCTNDNPVRTRPPAPPSYEDLYGDDGHQPLKQKNSPKQNGDMEEYDLDLNLSVDSNSDQTVKIQEPDGDKHREAYEDLLKLLQLQQEKMTMQESQMHHIDSDILFWEEKDQSETRELSLLKEQRKELDITCKHYENEISDTEFLAGMLSHEIESQKSLQSELKSTQSKLSTCDSDLSKSKDHLENLLRELEGEQRELEERIKADEAKLSEELRDLKKRLDEAHVNSKQMDESGGDTEATLSSLAEIMAKKKSEATQLEQDLKEVNLVLFMSAPTDFTLESEDKKTSKPPPRTGTSRKMTASPHVLAETVPTARHPHGLWV